MINIKIGKVTVRFDETIEDSVEPQYIGMPNEVAEVVETLSYSGGKYGNIFNPRNCFTVDLVIGIRNAYPDVAIPSDIPLYDPSIPDGAIP